MSLLLLNGDARKIPLADDSVNCIVTSPPYWGLRNYSEDAQIGLEQTPDEYIHEIVMVFRELRRVLHPTGTAWLNLGDSYAGSMAGLKPQDMVGIPWRVALTLQADGWWLRSDIIWQKTSPMPESTNGWRWEQHRIKKAKSNRALPDSYHTLSQPNGKPQSERNGRDFADQSGRYIDCPGCDKCEATDGLILRRGSWRPTSSYEHIFLLAKSPDYFCDKDAVTEPLADSSIGRMERKQSLIDRMGVGTLGKQIDITEGVEQNHAYAGLAMGRNGGTGYDINGRNQRDVWTISQAGWHGSHFAVFPPEIPRRCIKAGTSERGVCPDCGNPWARIVTKTTAVSRPDNPNDALPYDGQSGLTQGTGATTLHKHRGTITDGWKATCTCGKEPVPAVVLDPFAGSGTTLQAARELGRHGIGLDLSYTYLKDEANPRLSIDLLEAFEQGAGITVSQEVRRKRTVSENQMSLL